jgi:hypothetical protein
MEGTKGAVVHGTEDDALWEDSDKDLSVDGLGHPGCSDRQYTILAHKIKCCLVKFKYINLLLNV